jgi:hypothetical protein
MHHRSWIGAIAFTALLAGLSASLTAGPSAAQGLDQSKYPNLKGQWVRVPGNPNNWIQAAGPPPLTPEYQKKFEAIQADLKSGGPGNWPSTFCVPQGMPAMMNLYDPMEIIVTPEITYILISHVDDSYRRIYTDGRDWPKNEEPTYAGYSLGKWIDEDGDGRYDVLEIETRNLKGPRSYDIAGIPMHEDNETVVKERLYLTKDNPNAIVDDITVYDHSLTRPWSITKRATRNPNPRPVWHSDVCSEDNTWVRIENEGYYLSADGKLMPAKKNQTPPDLRYFKQTAK